MHVVLPFLHTQIHSSILSKLLKSLWPLESTDFHDSLLMLPLQNLHEKLYYNSPYQSRDLEPWMLYLHHGSQNAEHMVGFLLQTMLVLDLAVL